MSQEPGSLVDELRALIAAVPEEGLPETVQILRDIVEFYNMPKVTVPEPEIRYLKSSGVRIQERPPFYLDLGEAADMAAEHEARWQAERDELRATIERLEQDASRLDWLDTIPPRHGWNGWIIDYDGEIAMGSMHGPIREVIDAAIAREGRVMP